MQSVPPVIIVVHCFLWHSECSLKSEKNTELITSQLRLGDYKLLKTKPGNGEFE